MSIHQPYSKLLINEEPLQVLPGLASAIGLNEAIVLQQLHYWLRKSNVGSLHEGRPWVYNTYDQWHENFPFWSIDTIKRTILRLEKDGLVESTDRFNRDTRDRTKWYTINYEHESLHGGNGNLPSSTSDAICPPHNGNLPSSTIEQRLHTETTAEINTESDTEREYQQAVFDKWYDTYPRKVGKADARKAFAKVIKTVPLTRLIEAVENQKQGEQWRDPKYIPHPATWLNREGWEDEVIPAKPTAPSRAQFNDPQKYSREQVMLDIANMKAGR